MEWYEEEILRWMKEKGRVTYKELVMKAIELGLSPGSVSWMLKGLMSAGYIRRPTRGLYEITERGCKAVEEVGE